MSSTLVLYNDLMLTAIDGRPRVLAFVNAWHPERTAAHELHAMRVQLRGLGAVLVILSEFGAWSFAPDDDLERFEVRRAALDREIAEAAEQYGVPAGCDAVVILDGHGAVRFSHVVPGPLPTTLDAALDAAGAALLATPRAPILFTRREWALTSLCAGFAVVLLGCTFVVMRAERHATTDDEVRDTMSGSVCRCGTCPTEVRA